MATVIPPPGKFAVENPNALDPFVASNQEAQRQRYAAFDSSQDSLYLSGSPAQAKRALEAHLAETTRRLQETSNLGNALVHQRQELEERLKEVSEQEQASTVGPELRQKLAELEKEFNEVGSQTARAFMPKSRAPSGETDPSAHVYTSESHQSPTKISVPSRKQRNHAPSRVNDIELATEISTSLLAQLRDLQAVLLEKDEALKAANLDRGQLEIEVEGLSQRLRGLDESESRLKDVNWNLETQVRDFETQAKAATDRENRLNHNLNLAKTEKATLEREYEELKQLHAKTSEELAIKNKQHESELSGLRRNVSMGETERGALQRKMEELATQNHELARVVQHRMRADEQGSAEEASPDDNPDGGNTLTPEHSPPVSPVKATPRHGQLESETLKHSLNHAHRMIQQLKNNIHREKTEKIELKRMLQDARDELETSRNAMNGPSSASKRRKADKDVFKKPARPDRLGALRRDSHEIVTMEDDEWEDHEVPFTPSKSRQVSGVPGAFPSGFSSAAETSANEGFETANETSDAAFETANERDGMTTETDAFQTGVETLDGNSSDDLTETEARPATIRHKPSMVRSQRDAYESTASTSGDEWDEPEIRTPQQPGSARYKLRVARSRRSTPRAQDLFSDSSAQNSPASMANDSRNATPAQGRSLFAELGALSESEDGSIIEGTPRSVLSPGSPEAVRKGMLERSPMITSRSTMVDSGMMTEEWLPPVKPSDMSSISSQHTEPYTVPAPTFAMASHVTQGTEPQTPPAPTFAMATHVSQGTEPQSVPAPTFTMATHISQGTEPQSVVLPPFTMSAHAVQDTTPQSVPLPDLRLSTMAVQGTEPQSIPAPDLRMSTMAVQGTEPRAAPPTPLYLSSLAEQNTIPQQAILPPLNISTVSGRDTVPSAPAVPSLDMSGVRSQDTAPQAAQQPAHSWSSFAMQQTEPVSSVVARAIPSMLGVSSIAGHATEPVESRSSSGSYTTSSLASISTQATEPTETHDSMASMAKAVPFEEEAPKIPLSMSSFSSQASAPREVQRKPWAISGLSSQGTAPVELPRVAPPQLSRVAVQDTQPVEPPRPAPSQIAVTSHQATEPVAARAPASALSSVAQQSTQPVAQTIPSSQISVVSHQTTEPTALPASALSSVSHQVTEPRALPASTLSSVSHQTTEPRALPASTLSSHWSLATEPVSRPRPALPQLSTLSHQTTSPREPARAPWQVGSIATQHTQPVHVRETEHGFSNVTTLQNTEPESPTLPAFLPSPSRPSTANRVLPALSAISAIVSQHTEPNVPSRPATAVREREVGFPFPPASPMSDEGTQTMVSAEQIDRLLLARTQRLSGTIATANVEKSVSPPASPSRRYSNENGRLPRRPGSASSTRSRGVEAPPLPPDHKEVIAAAALKSKPSLLSPSSPGTMGPPVIPASAYKNRPQTPSIKARSTTASPRPGTASRQRWTSQPRSGASSPVTRQSSVSSFTSEIDQRFNIPGGPSFSESGLDPNTTDPRMIQAITQTMIGEFLWKYTRKAGRETMSETRHRRFFWVHPYTRTLYWSEQDPQTAGRAQLKAKSVAIEAVHEVSDDNSSPPGLHHKSLVVTTPGRTLKFTATTSQRHETWFNALTYLLRRTEHEGQPAVASTSEIQNEFNGGYRSISRMTGRSRASQSTHATSRRTSSPSHAEIPTLRQSTIPNLRPHASDSTVGSRFSTIMRSSSAMRGSFASRYSKAGAQEAIIDDPNESIASIESPVRDAAHFGLLDVRACCDGEFTLDLTSSNLTYIGKHHVGQLHHHHHNTVKGRHNSFNSRPSFIGSMSSRSHSRAESHTKTDAVRPADVQSQHSAAG